MFVVIIITNIVDVQMKNEKENDEFESNVCICCDAWKKDKTFNKNGKKSVNIKYFLWVLRSCLTCACASVCFVGKLKVKKFNY